MEEDIVLCDECADKFFQEWVDRQCKLDEFLKEYFPNATKRSRDATREWILRNMNKQYCVTCNHFFLDSRNKKYCCDACKQKAYRDRSNKK